MSKLGRHVIKNYSLTGENVVHTKPAIPGQMEITVGFLNGWLERKSGN